MNTIKTITLSLLSLVSISLHAQSFKEPVAYKLKNGMNIIISEIIARQKLMQVLL